MAEHPRSARHVGVLHAAGTLRARTSPLELAAVNTFIPLIAGCSIECDLRDTGSL